nr:putative glycosyltransferase 7 [Quercus suber]
MVSPEMAQFHTSHMAKPSVRNKASVWLTDSLIFLSGAFFALLLVWTFSSFSSPTPNPDFSPTQARSNSTHNCAVNLTKDSDESTFYDEPELGYSIGNPVKNWDEKRREWLKHHPSFAAGASERVVMVSGSQPKPCKNPIGDHLLLRFFKNKVDYCRIHGYDIFYNNALLHPKMGSYWAKLAVVRAAMLAHPEAEWIWWVDSDALFTDMEFKPPLHRNCQWSMDLIDVWASMGPQTPDYNKWGQILRSTFKDKLFPESDDQTGLIYLIYKEGDRWADKIYLEGEYYFEGYWHEIVGTLDNITERYMEIEREDRKLRRRHAEKVSEQYGAFREKHLKDAGNGRWSWRRPFITHFTGCQPCSGNHNQMYLGTSCWDGMQKALNFADNQVIRKYGFVHPNPLDSSLSAVPFDYPAEEDGWYKDHNFIVHGWAKLIYEAKSWTGLNAGVFLIRNCQWSMDLIDVWASMGPQTPDYNKWGQILRSTFKDKLFPESDDQTGLIYLIYKEGDRWADKIYLEGEYYFEGYWHEIVGTLDNITERYMEIEREDRKLRRRHAEKVSEQYGAFREKHLKDAGNGRWSWRRPFITHFTGCQPCSGNHNQMYLGTSCWDGMQKALNFADNQVIRKYGFVHPNPLDSSLSAVPFDYPAEEDGW